MQAYNQFETNLDARLDVMLNARGGRDEDVLFLIACVRHWRDKAVELQEEREYADRCGDDN